MLVLEVFRYIKRRTVRKPVRLANRKSFIEHHGAPRNETKIAIVIPTRDKVELLRSCIESIESKTTYSNYEILVVDNESSDPKTLDYLASLRSLGYTVLDYPEQFNYSKICNFAASYSSAAYLCFLNNDTEVIEPEWLESLMQHAVQPGVGLVGSKLLYKEGSIQHIGIALGYAGVAGHPFSGVSDEELGLFGQEGACFEVSAVTFACALVSRKIYFEVGGLDEKFKVGLNDVDFSLKLRGAGYKTAICTRSTLIHYESRSRKSMKSLSGSFRAIVEVMHFLNKWSSEQRREDYFCEE